MFLDRKSEATCGMTLRTCVCVGGGGGGEDKKRDLLVIIAPCPMYIVPWGFWQVHEYHKHTAGCTTTQPHYHDFYILKSMG